MSVFSSDHCLVRSQSGVVRYMTGWRIGYIGGPKHVIDAINKLQSQMTSHITSFTQLPAATALNDPRGKETIESMMKC